jgi:predicted nucleotidyltransferase
MKKNRIRVKLPKQKIEDFCRRHHTPKLAVFGSHWLEDFRAKSDSDVLVDLKRSIRPD